MKKIIAGMLATVLSAMVVLSCSAETVMFTRSTKNLVWEPYGVSCKLNRPGKKNASVKVTLASSYLSKYGYYAVDILMKDEHGRYIWAEDDSIVAKKSYYTSRTYKLGKDHNEYRLFFRPSNKKLNAGAYVIVSNPKQCYLGTCYDGSL